MVLTEAEAAFGSTCTKPWPQEQSRGARERDSWRCVRAGRSPERERWPLPRQGRGQGRGAGGRRSYHVVLRHELSPAEAGRAELADVERGLAVDDELGDELTRRRRVHDAVPRESRGADEPFDSVDRSENWVLVGSVLVEPRPTRLYRCPFEDRKARQRPLDDRGHEILIHAVVEPGLLVRVGHPEEHASGFSVRVEAGGEFDREREVLIEAGHGFGDEDVPAQWGDRQIDPGELRDL